jgi:hypothetical protein
MAGDSNQVSSVNKSNLTYFYNQDHINAARVKKKDTNLIRINQRTINGSIDKYIKCSTNDLGEEIQHKPDPDLQVTEIVTLI